MENKKWLIFAVDGQNQWKHIFITEITAKKPQSTKLYKDLRAKVLGNDNYRGIGYTNDQGERTLMFNETLKF